MSKWQPIETAPKEIDWRKDGHEYGKHILVWPYYGEVVRAKWEQWRNESGEIIGSSFIVDGGYNVWPTHWRPVPKPPGEDKDTFAARLAERIAELEAEREQAKGDTRIIINGQIGLIRAIAHNYSEATND